MYKNNSRDCSKFKGFSPFQLSYNLTGNYHAICHYSYNLPLKQEYKMQIEKLNSKNYKGIITVWNKAIRATHNFLSEDDIQILERKTLIELFESVSIYGIRVNNKELAEFVGINQNIIEMLFVSPDFTKKGIGSFLLNFAITENGAHKLEVYEHNKNAIRLYEKSGFIKASREDCDPLINKPYSILKMIKKK